jgi:hypothetical protein
LPDAVGRRQPVVVTPAVGDRAVVVGGDVGEALEERLATGGGAAEDLVAVDRRPAVSGRSDGVAGGCAADTSFDCRLSPIRLEALTR